MDVNLYTWIRYKKDIEKLFGCCIDSHKTCNIILEVTNKVISSEHLDTK